MSDIAIRVEGLGKEYRIGKQERYRTLRDTLTDSFAAPIRRMRSLFRASASNGVGPPAETIWALKDVSFEVPRGAVLGVIGRNGAGKSTLLKILSRITEPTEGRVQISGRVGSLLEVGTGFHGELSGRENIFLNGAILGMKRAEITRKFDEIVAFAEIEKFIDTPVKHYSSGMYMRLAFAVAAHLDPEILIVDEVLAVGDHAFQTKCLGKMDNLARCGRTILFVSHNMGAIGRLCRSCIWLEGGTIASEGLTPDVIQRYQTGRWLPRPEWRRSTDPRSDVHFSFQSVRLAGQDGNVNCYFAGDETIYLSITYEVRCHLGACVIGIRVLNAGGVLFSTTDADEAGVLALPKLPGVYETNVAIPGNWLNPGSYSLFIAAYSPNRQFYEVLDEPVSFEVSMIGSLTSLDHRYGMFAPLLRWETAPTNPSAPRNRATLHSGSLS